MTTYRVAVGHNIALGSLTVLSPQPTSTGIQAARRSYGADGTPVDEGLFVELEWSVIKDATTYQNILTQFGIHVLPSSLVTVYVRDQRLQWVRCNGLAVLPEMGREARWERFRLRQLTILVRNLSILS